MTPKYLTNVSREEFDSVRDNYTSLKLEAHRHYIENYLGEKPTIIPGPVFLLGQPEYNEKNRRLGLRCNGDMFGFDHESDPQLKSLEFVINMHILKVRFAVKDNFSPD